MFLGLVPIPDGSPWFYVDEKHSENLSEELKSEIGPKHFLFEWYEKLVVIAKCGGNDDVLVAINDDFRRFFWVHLTFSGKVDQLPSRYPDAGPVLNADLVQFFDDYSRVSAKELYPKIMLEQAALLEKLSSTLADLEKAEEIVICADSPDHAARKLLEAIRYNTLDG